MRPLEVVRYSMEKLDWHDAVDLLAAFGELEAPVWGWILVPLVMAFWLVGFLGARLVAVRSWAGDLFTGGSALRRTMAWFVAIGFPVSLVFRIAPAESQGLSRLEAQNDVVWFAAASGALLWFWVADVVRSRVAIALVLVLALPSTVQHFVHAHSLEPDRVGAQRMVAARAAASLSEPGSVWIDPIDRSRPSLLPYFSGRAVVYDPYVGYDYMFVGRDEIDFRRHAIAQFWSSSDPALRAWVLEHYDVEYVWHRGGPDPVRVLGLESLYSNEDVSLLRVDRERLEKASLSRIVTPTRLPLGNRGSPYFGAGFVRSGRTRRLEPGSTRLYLPRAAGRGLTVTLAVQPMHGGGELVIGDERAEVETDQVRVDVSVPAAETEGLHALDVRWSGERPLEIFAITIE